MYDDSVRICNVLQTYYKKSILSEDKSVNIRKRFTFEKRIGI